MSFCLAGSLIGLLLTVAVVGGVGFLAAERNIDGLANRDETRSVALVEAERHLVSAQDALGRAAVASNAATRFSVADSLMGEGLEDLVALADDALLHAKRSGRDRVVVAGREPVDPVPEDRHRSNQGPHGRSTPTPSRGPQRRLLRLAVPLVALAGAFTLAAT